MPRPFQWLLLAASLLAACMVFAAPAASPKPVVTWVQPAEGAVIDGTATLHFKRSDNKELWFTDCYLQACGPLNYVEFERKYGEQWHTDEGCPDELGIFNTTLKYLSEQLPDFGMPEKPLSFPPMRIAIHPHWRPTADGALECLEDFNEPLPFDFSAILPGSYKLIVINEGEMQAERTIEVKSRAAAPQISIDPLVQPRFTPSGELLLTGRIVDADARHETEILKPEIYHDQQRIWSEFACREGSVLVAVDGMYAGYANNVSFFDEGLPPDRAWQVKLPLAGDLMYDPETFHWSPGPHRVTAITTDMHGNGGVITKVLSLPLTFLDIVVDDRQDFVDRYLVKTPMRLRALPSGGAELEYAFYLAEGAGWRTLRDFSPDDIFDWTPETAGARQVKVIARERDGSRSRMALYTVQVVNPLTALHLSASPAGKVPAWSDLTVKVQADGGVDLRYTYQFFDGKQWKTLAARDYSDFWPMMPTRQGACRMKVTAVDLKTEQRASAQLPITVGPAAPLTDVKITVGNDIEAVRVGGDNTVSYQFFVSRDQKKWTPCRGHVNAHDRGASVEANFDDIKPYYLRVSATQKSTGRVVTAEAKYQYNTDILPCKEVRITPDKPSPQPVNSTIILTGMPIGGEGWLIYPTFTVNDGTGWQEARWDILESEHPAICWRPAAPGTYRIRFKTTQKEGTDEGAPGTELSDEIEYTITD